MRLARLRRSFGSMTRFHLVLACSLWASIFGLPGHASPVEPELASLVEADWAAQERRLGREPGSLEALEAALGRGQRLLNDLSLELQAADLDIERRRWESLQTEVRAASRLPSAERLALYHRVRWSGRDLADRKSDV